jgi:glutamate carboxypeptidase
MKGGISVLLAALEAFETHPDRDASAGPSCCQPRRGDRLPRLRSPAGELGARGHVGMTYEPALADGTLAGARKGSGNYHLIVTARPPMRAAPSTKAPTPSPAPPSSPPACMP